MNSEAVAISWKDVEDPSVLLVESNGTNRREQKHLLDLFGAAPGRQA